MGQRLQGAKEGPLRGVKWRGGLDLPAISQNNVPLKPNYAASECGTVAAPSTNYPLSHPQTPPTPPRRTHPHLSIPTSRGRPSPDASPTAEKVRRQRHRCGAAAHPPPLPLP
jgi:hypothetical protein